MKIVANPDSLQLITGNRINQKHHRQSLNWCSLIFSSVLKLESHVWVYQSGKFINVAMLKTVTA